MNGGGKGPSASVRLPAALLAAAAALIVALPAIRAETAVPDAIVGATLAVLLVAGGAELASRLPWPSSPAHLRRAGVWAAVAGGVGVLCCALAASRLADDWPADARTLAALAGVAGVVLLAGGSTLVRRAERARAEDAAVRAWRRGTRP